MIKRKEIGLDRGDFYEICRLKEKVFTVVKRSNKKWWLFERLRGFLWIINIVYGGKPHGKSPVKIEWN